MPYATATDLAARLAPELLQELADDDGDSMPDTIVLDAALADATAEINQKLSGRYVTPIDPAPDILKRWCADLATAALFLRRRKSMPTAHAEQVALTRRALNAIADGLACLACATPRPLDLEADCTRIGDDLVFSNEGLEEY
jgi:phage gp36-like protein